MSIPEFINDPLFRKILVMQADRIAEELRQVKHDIILSVGSGISAVEFCLIVEEKIFSRIISIELQYAQCLAASAYNLPEHFCIQLDMNSLPIMDQSVDCLLLLNAYHHIHVHRRPDFDREISLIVRSGGKVITIEPIAKPWQILGRLLIPAKWDKVHDPGESELTNSDLARLRENLGFSGISYQPSYICRPALTVCFIAKVGSFPDRTFKSGGFFVSLCWNWVDVLFDIQYGAGR